MKYVVLDVPHRIGTPKPWRASCFHDDDNGIAVDAAVARAEEPLEALKLACAEAASRDFAPTEFHVKPSAMVALRGVLDFVDVADSPVLGLRVVVRGQP